MPRLPNPFRQFVLLVGLALARFGVVDRQRAVETTDLAWPRIVTGVARMSKNAVDVAMVGVGVGTAAVAGVGFAGPFWGLAFAVGGGVAGGTIALVSQRFGAGASEELGLAVRSSTLLVVVCSLPITAVFWLVPAELVSLLTDNPDTVRYGGAYLRVVGLGIPFAGLNLVGSRVLVGADDAYRAMQFRASGAVVNVVLNAVFIFGLGWGVAGAATGTVLSNVVVTAAFALGLTRGRFPGMGEFPVRVSPYGSYVDGSTLASLVKIGVPVGFRNLVWTVAEFPMLAILAVFGTNTVAAFVIARRIWGVMNTPGWGFGLASSSLVGQALGEGRETEAERYGHEIIRFSVAVYLVSALLIAVSAEWLVVLFTGSPGGETVAVATNLVYAACVAVVFQGVSGGATGPLDASGDTVVPFLSQFVGMFLVSVPLAAVGALTGNLWWLYLAFLAETTVPAAINYWRFSSQRWKSISRQYRPEAVTAD